MAVSLCNLHFTRYCMEDALFAVKEVDLTIMAYLGTLEGLPGIVVFGIAMNLALTARRFSGFEAKELGLVNRASSSKDSLKKGAGIAEGEFIIKHS